MDLRQKSRKYFYICQRIIQLNPVSTHDYKNKQKLYKLGLGVSLNLIKGI